MKLVCSVSVGNRLLPPLAVNARRQHVKSTLALCKHPKLNEFYIILFTEQNKNGTKYELKGNISRIFTRFINEGKATIQFITPTHDLYIQADRIQLKSFLNLFKLALQNKVPEDCPVSSMSVTPVSLKNVAPKKLVIRKRSDYPAKGLPRTLEVLHINEIQRCGLDRGILNLVKLKFLDLSHNCIEYLPPEFNTLPNLSEFNISHNCLGKGSPKQWEWIGGSLSKTLKLLNLSNNNLQFLPDHLVKLHVLIFLHVDNNELRHLPPGIGMLRQLKFFTMSHNLISTFPGSVRQWKLQMLDISNNNFKINQDHPRTVPEKQLSMCTLKEYAAREVLSLQLPYGPDIIPRTVIDYLNSAKYCICGKACFQCFIKFAHMLLCDSLAQSVYLSSTIIMMYVPVDCYFCSIKCFNSIVNRARFAIT